MPGWVAKLPGLVGCRCGCCGRIVKSAYRPRRPAPCGCAWLEAGGRVLAVPNRSEYLSKSWVRLERRG